MTSFTHALGGCLLLTTAACSKPPCDYDRPSCDPTTVCAYIEKQKSQCVPYAESAVEVSPPFHVGQLFWCAQGGRSPSGRTHSFEGDLFALDLPPASSAADVEVVTPAAGTAYVFDDCDERDAGANAHYDTRCGLGYGNHVKIWDGKEIYFFGHLARVLVRNGPVQRDQAIGVTGASGAAGPRHLHFVLSRPGPGDDVEKILSTPGWKGRVPVRYRISARDAATIEPVSAWPDTLSCSDDRAHARVLMR